ncbi:MAG: hypothetical protein LBP25_03380 [Tannerellaceae bacterium]|jgi:hypothetical protein|nr:hypothetical protein [Tannerellaceae bacterium]
MKHSSISIISNVIILFSGLFIPGDLFAQYRPQETIWSAPNEKLIKYDFYAGTGEGGLYGYGATFNSYSAGMDMYMHLISRYAYGYSSGDWGRWGAYHRTRFELKSIFVKSGIGFTVLDNHEKVGNFRAGARAYSISIPMEIGVMADYTDDSWPFGNFFHLGVVHHINVKKPASNAEGGIKVYSLSVTAGTELAIARRVMIGAELAYSLTPWMQKYQEPEKIHLFGYSFKIGYLIWKD